MSTKPLKVSRSILSMTLPSFLVSVAGGCGWTSEVGLIQEDGGVYVRCDRSSVRELLTVLVEANGRVSASLLVDGFISPAKRYHSVTVDGVLAMLTAPSPFEAQKRKRKQPLPVPNFHPNGFEIFLMLVFFPIILVVWAIAVKTIIRIFRGES